MARILIVEDEKNIQAIISEYMQKGGHSCFTADDGIDAMIALKNNPMDLLILDVMMPHLDGFSVCKLAREISNMPIIMLTAKSDEADKLKGYEYGADDYVTKPFRPLELIARVKAQLRRYKKYTSVQNEKHSSPILAYRKLTLNTQTYECQLEGKDIALTPTEFSVLPVLLESQDVIVTLEDLFYAVWKDEYYSKNSSTITVHIRHIREKLNDIGEKPQYIKTIWGVGYKI